MSGRRVLILGSAGQLGRQLVMAFEAVGDTVISLDHATFDLADADAGARVAAERPELVVNAAAWTDVDGCARDPERAMELNGAAPGRVAAAAAKESARFVQISTNEVFDGESEVPYDEDAEPRPINPYGVSKLAGERAVAAATADHLIVRTAWIFGPGGRNFPSKIVTAAQRAMERGDPLRVVDDEFGNPTWAPDLADAIVAAIAAGARGILHVAGEPPTTRYEWAREVLGGMPGLELAPMKLADYPRPAPVPARAILGLEREAAMGLGPLDWRPPTGRYAAQLLAAVAP
jgi:dTDP-4-dehydrorhamnose reductase